MTDEAIISDLESAHGSQKKVYIEAAGRMASKAKAKESMYCLIEDLKNNPSEEMFSVVSDLTKWFKEDFGQSFDDAKITCPVANGTLKQKMESCSQNPDLSDTCLYYEKFDEKDKWYKKSIATLGALMERIKNEEDRLYKQAKELLKALESDKAYVKTTLGI